MTAVIRSALPWVGVVLGTEDEVKAAALADHGDQAAARVKVLLMHIQMVRQVLDTLGQYGDLHFGRTGITLSGGVFPRPGW